MGGKSPPPAPPPTPPRETSAAATGTNVSTAIANAFLGNVNQSTPDGSLRFDVTDSYTWTDPYTNSTYTTPRFTATQTLSPQQQAIKTQNDRADVALSTTAANQSEFLQNYLGNPLQLNDLGPRPAAPTLQTSYDTEFTKDRQRTEDALYSRLNPQLERDRASLETQLSNQGIKLGSEAYDRAMQNFGQQSNDARMAAILNSGQEQSRLASLAQQSANFGNSAKTDQYNAELASRQQGLQENFALRNQPINEISALLSGSQVSQPNFVNAQMPRIPTTDNAAIIANYDNQQLQRYQAQQQAQQASNAQRNSLLGGILGGGASILSAGLRFSDERMKENKKKVGTLKGHVLYEYNYKGDGKKQIGVMAQQVEKKRPDAVKKTAGGVRMVDYGALFHAGKEDR